MTSLSYTEEAIQASPLLDEEQWQALLQELSPELLFECAKELLQEIDEQWVQGASAALVLSPAEFCAMAHKSAGAAGTMAFAKLRLVFLGLEHGGQAAQSPAQVGRVATVLAATTAYLSALQQA